MAENSLRYLRTGTDPLKDKIFALGLSLTPNVSLEAVGEAEIAKLMKDIARRYGIQEVCLNDINSNPDLMALIEDYLNAT